MKYKITTLITIKVREISLSIAHDNRGLTMKVTKWLWGGKSGGHLTCLSGRLKMKLAAAPAVRGKATLSSGFHADLAALVFRLTCLSVLTVDGLRSRACPPRVWDSPWSSRQFTTHNSQTSSLSSPTQSVGGRGHNGTKGGRDLLTAFSKSNI